MNIEDKHLDCDAVFNNEKEKCSSLKRISDRDYQYIERSCRKRPPGGNSMYSSTKTSDTSFTSTMTSSITEKPSYDPTTGQRQNNRFMMNGTQMNNRQWKLNSTSSTNIIESHKRKLNDDSASLDSQKVEKPLGRSEMVSDNNNRRLLTLHQIPTHLRFNRFVLSHYRAPTDWKGCILSLGYMHNETINILTHGKTHQYSTFLYFTYYFYYSCMFNLKCKKKDVVSANEH